MKPTLVYFNTSIFSALTQSGMEPGSESFVSAIKDYYQQLYVETNQIALTIVKNDDIIVLVYEMGSDPMPHIAHLLNNKRTNDAIQYLEILNEYHPNDDTVLYNLGLASNDNGKYELAAEFLRRSIHVNPNEVNTWVGLGVSYVYLKKTTEAKKAFNQAISMDPANGYAHRNLGALLSMENNHTEALAHFTEALHQLPNDADTIYGMASCLIDLQRADEADELFKKIIEEHPGSHLCELSKEKRTQYAQNKFKNNTIGSFRYDIMMYILETLRTFKDLNKDKVKEIAFEVAIKGADGLKINDPDVTYTLSTMSGEYTGAHLLAIMYTGFQAIDPSIDVGADFKEEYKAAKSLLAISD